MQQYHTPVLGRTLNNIIYDEIRPTPQSPVARVNIPHHRVHLLFFHELLKGWKSVGLSRVGRPARRAKQGNPRAMVSQGLVDSRLRLTLALGTGLCNCADGTGRGVCRQAFDGVLRLGKRLIVLTTPKQL